MNNGINLFEDNAQRYARELYPLASRYLAAGFKQGQTWLANAKVEHLLKVVDYLRDFQDNPNEYATLDATFSAVESYLESLKDPKLALWHYSGEAVDYCDTDKLTDPSTDIIGGVHVTTLGGYWFTGWAEACLNAADTFGPRRSDTDDHAITHGECVFRVTPDMYDRVTSINGGQY